MKNYEHPLWSRLYDVMHSGDAADVEFYVREARQAKGPVLEVACGTGRILLPMLRHGVDGWGIDISQPMLDRLQEKACHLGLVPKVVCADMRHFSLPERFSLIIVPFRSFLHMETPEDQIAALSCFRAHLSPGGRLILNFFSPSPHSLISDDGKLRFARELIDPVSGRTVKAWQAVNNDPLNRRQTIDWVLHELDETGRTVETTNLSLNLRWVDKAEFEVLLKSAGYSSWKVYGGFDGEPLEREDQEMVWIASV